LEWIGHAVKNGLGKDSYGNIRVNEREVEEREDLD
jgi:hypothetical protein